MSISVGIDLGTTNSAICSFDGAEVTLYKSPEQADVTPSAIFIDRRGNRYVGMRAYANAARDPDHAATLFKRLMGTSTPITLAAVNVTMTPVQCSAEILKTLFGYLPEEVRNDPEIGTVITVPAAFNQMQKDATLAAAEAAGIGKVALMQEPVAAVMSAMRRRRGDGIFLIFDIGGGTLDVAIAQSIGGRVSLLGQGGIAMCGGRDFDRLLIDNIVVPWLTSHFRLPQGFAGDPAFSRLRRMAEHAAEKAKIELSARDEAVIAASESDLGTKDKAGEEIYLDCPVTRQEFDALIAGHVDDAIGAAREAIAKAGLSPHDIERIVFVGGPSQYKPLRDKVAFELGIAASTDVNPMTAVAEGAAIFAESVDWSSHNRSRKSARGSVSAGGALDITLNFVARTPDDKAKLALKIGGGVLPGASFQVDSLDTGWTSGRMDLRSGIMTDLPLARAGDNTFKVFVFDPSGGPVALKQDRVVITRTAATVDAIPASHSLGFEVRDRVGGGTVLDFLVKEGDQLPVRGQKRYKAGESIRAGSSASLNFTLYEGGIVHPVGDNRFVGLFKVSGTDFSDNVIVAGAELVIDYEVTDGGNVVFEVSVPSIQASFQSGRNYYSRTEGEFDFTTHARRVREDAERVSLQVAELERHVQDDNLEAARRKLDGALALSPTEIRPETTKQAADDVHKAKELLARARRANLKVTRRIELEQVTDHFDKAARRFAKPAEETSFDALARTTAQKIADPGPDFESHVDELWGKCFGILVRQDWFIIDRFNRFVENPHLFADAKLHAELAGEGSRALSRNDIDALRQVLQQMEDNRISTTGVEEFLVQSNIVRG